VIPEALGLQYGVLDLVKGVATLLSLERHP
jgi:hypothetical protein